jgi:hypothetical protein
MKPSHAERLPANNRPREFDVPDYTGNFDNKKIDPSLELVQGEPKINLQGVSETKKIDTEKDVQSLRANRESLMDDIAIRSIQVQRMSSEDPKAKKIRDEQAKLRQILSKVDNELLDLQPPKPFRDPGENIRDIQAALDSLEAQLSSTTVSEAASAEDSLDVEDTEFIVTNSLEEVIAQLQQNIKIARSEIKAIQESDLSEDEQYSQIAEAVKDIKRYRADIAQYSAEIEANRDGVLSLEDLSVPEKIKPPTIDEQRTEVYQDAEISNGAMKFESFNQSPRVEKSSEYEKDVALEEEISLDLREQIAEINTAVREGKMKTEEADSLIFDLEQQIYNRENAQDQQIERDIVSEEQPKEITPSDSSSKVMENENSPEIEPVVTVEQSAADGDGGGPVEKTPEEPSEHWQLKRAMREAKDAYLTKLDEQAKQRGIFKKWIGFGRKDLDPEVQSAYDAFMTANKAYYQYAEDSGRYEKLDGWLRKRRMKAEQPVESVGVYGAVAERHVFRPARERLALQEREMPSAVRKLLGKIASNPKLKYGLIASSMISTAGGALFGMIAGKATKWGLERTYVAGKEREHQLDHKEILEMIEAGEKVDLDDLEELYYSSALAIDNARVKATVAGVAVGAATTAGAGYAIGNEILSQGAVTGAETVDSASLSPEELGLTDNVQTPPVEVDYDATVVEQTTTGPEVITIEAEPTVPVKVEVPEQVVVTPENPLSTPSETLGTSSGVEGEAVSSVTVEDQDIAAVDGGLEDSVTDYEQSATDSGTNSATESAQEVQKISVARNGEFELATPDEEIKVISPFEYESPHVTSSHDDLLEVMIDRVKAGVEAGNITFDPNLSEHDLRYMLLDKLPELKQPDEGLWFQRAAEPGLSAEVWKEIGVPSGDPLEIPPGTEIDMKQLLDKAFGVETETATPPVEVPSTTSPAVESGEVPTVQPESAIEETFQRVSNSETPVETTGGRTFATDETTIASRGSILAERGDLGTTALNERLFGYQPQMSAEFDKAVMTVNEGVSQSDFARELHQQTYAAYKAGDISLPTDIMKRVEINPTAINAFVDRNAAEFAEFNPFISKKELDLTSDQWKELGFSSGDPDKIVSGDTIQMGKLIKLILENAAEKINGKLRI